MTDLKNGQSVNIDITNPLAAFIGITVTAGEIETKFIGSNKPAKSLFPKSTPYIIRRPSNASKIQLKGVGDVNSYSEPLEAYTSEKKPTGLDKIPYESA